MLKRIRKPNARASGASFAIVASTYNSRYVDSMLAAALAELKAAGAGEVKVVRVPGAYEVPIVAARLARRGGKSRAAQRGKRFSAILCIGLIIRGETAHADHIGEAVSRALMEIQVATEVPVIHTVLLMENEKQAVKRCLGKEHNRGIEAARTAIEMSRVMRGLD